MALQQLQLMWWRYFGPKSVRDKFSWLAREAADARPNQNHGHRVVHEICWLIAESSNGSLHQYVINSTGDTFHDTARYLAEVGATESQAVLEQLAADAFPDGRVPSNREERCAVFVPWADQPEHEARLRELTKILLGGLDNLMERVVGYAYEHPEYFPKLPRSN